MPRFEPFPALLYDEGALRRLGQSLADVVAPPYDVISPAEREELCRRSVHNSVRVELPADDPERGLDRYQSARRLLEDWEAAGILRREAGPAFYAYRISFRDHVGRDRSTLGVIGALEVTEAGRGDVLPHEHTMPKPKGDRLDLLRTTTTNTSPIWGLSLASGLSDAMSPSGRPDLSVVDNGARHEIWRISSPSSVEAVRDLVGAAPVVIADGHHRYETAIAYRDERRSSGEGDGADLVMTFVVELADDELSVRPIHRLISGLPAGLDLPGHMKGAFRVVEAGEPGPELLDRMERHGGLALLVRGASWLLEPRPETVAAAGMDLDSSRLELALKGLPPHELAYEADLDTVLRSVDTGEAAAGVLLRPATVSVIAAAARAGAKMPPKTTYFAPKPRTGLVFRPLGP